MEKEEKIKKIFDPYEAGVTKQLDAKNVRNLSSRQPVGDVRHSNIFSKLGLSQEESNLAHHFTTSSDRYINQFNKTNPSHPLPSDNNDVRLHLLGRFARTLNGSPSHSTMVSLLEKLADNGLITRNTRNPGKSNQYIMKGFKLQKGPAAQEESPEETTPKSSTDVEETQLAPDVQPPVEENEEENEEEQDNEKDDEELRKLLEEDDTEDDELEKAFSTYTEEKETDPIKDKIHTLFLFKQNFSDPQKFLHYLPTHIDYLDLIEEGLTAEQIIELLKEHNATS